MSDSPKEPESNASSKGREEPVRSDTDDRPAAQKSLAGSGRPTPPSGGSSALKRYGPIAAIAALALAVVGVLALTGGGDGDDDSDPNVEVAGETADGDATGDGAAGDDAASDDSASGDDGADADPGDGGDDANQSDDDSSSNGDEGDAGNGGGGEAPASELPEGVMSFEYARENGIDIDAASFGERCDTETGLVKVPDFFRPTCWLPFEGDNGGATTTGVTGDSIKIIYYLGPDDDPIINYVTSAIVNDDSNEDYEATMRGLLPYYETYYETYGRSVDLEVFVGSGVANNAISARADAVAVAEKEPFMVWGGPALTNAFAEELHARGVPCIGCGPSQDKAFYDEFAPLSWSVTMGGQQANVHVAEYVSKRLAGRNAIHAGDDLKDSERVFGRLWIESSEASVIAHEKFEADLNAAGVELAESVRFTLDPASIAEQADAAIAKLKAQGVTTVILAADPVSPGNFTRAATDQGYEPEWFIPAPVLMDTNAFARSYDQDQWARAFGVSTLAVKVERDVASSYRKYEWFNGEPPPAADSIGVIDPTPSLFYAVISGVGPDLTIENFETALFAGAPTKDGITAPSLSWGNKGFWDTDRFEPDYRGIDDMTEFWWDPSAEGPDELDRDGAGLYRFVDNGKRYRPGDWPETDPNVFDAADTLTVLSEVPPEEAAPDFDPIK